MIRDLKYMIFGGIKWRFRSFLIGFFLGVAATGLFPSFVQNVSAAVIEDVSTYEQSDWANSNPTTAAYPYKVQGVVPTTSGHLDSIDFRFAKNPGAGGGLFSIQIYDYLNDYQPGNLLGSSTNYTFSSNDLHTSCGSSPYCMVNIPIEAVDGSKLQITEAQAFFIVLEAEDSAASPNNVKWLTQTTSSYEGNIASCTDDTFTTCTTPSTSTEVQFILNIDDDYLEVPTFSIESGPYFASTWGSGYYDIEYECYEDGDIYGQSDVLLDVSYNSLGVSCVEGDTGTLRLYLDTGNYTDWSLTLYQSGFPTTIYNIDILHDDIWLDGVGADGSPNIPALTDDESSLLSGIYSLFEFIEAVPIYGDVYQIGDLMLNEFYLKLDSDDYDGVFTLNGSFMGVPINQSYNIEAMAASIGDPVNLVTGFSDYKILVTSMLLLLVIISLWHKYTEKHVD